MISCVFNDDKIQLKPCKGKGIISKFKPSDWHLIASDIDDEKTLIDFLDNHSDFMECYLLSTKADNQPFAFFYLLHEYDDNRIVSFHGGGWNNTIRYNLLHFRAAFLIAHTLEENGIKVRTYCLASNEKAYRFLREVGYIKYRLNGDTIEMYHSEKKMKRSRLYQKLFG